MSRTPVKVLIETQASAPREPVIVRVQRAAIPTPDGTGTSGPVSFAVPAGSTHIILGGPGSGKSALLALIAMARPPARGGVELFGEDLAIVPTTDRHRLRRRIGMIFQRPRLIDSISVWANIALAAEAVGRKPTAYETEVKALLAWVGLGRRAEALAADLDPEGRRRLGLARALINRPDLIIADEPDDPGTRVVAKLLADLNRAGATILIATADEALAGAAGVSVTRFGPPPAIAIQTLRDDAVLSP